MLLYSTNTPTLRSDLREAIFKGLPDDNGLFMPVDIPRLPDIFLQNLPNHSFPDLSYIVAKTLLQGAIPDNDLREIIESAINFPAPLVRLNDRSFVLELFHGPSLAFKDFGARFMAQTMAYFNRAEDKELVILVATSGDTGGAVAAGFFKTPGIQVVILYPSGKVSHLQEQQLTTLGHNVTAIEVVGNFDDCQALVKKAFLDQEITRKIRLSSANSINIARLIPQSFYYFEAYKQALVHYQKGALPFPLVFSIPSGNFGNLTAGLMAKRMGLPVDHFIAATNLNDVVPEYLRNGTYTPRASVRTLSNAMDVGSPSNFVRMLDLYGSTWNIMKNDIIGYAFDDLATENAIKEIEQQYQYIMDPHGAVGYLALKKYQSENQNTIGIVLETAHPAKFLEDMERILKHHLAVPERLAAVSALQKKSVQMNTEYGNFKDWLIGRYF